MEAGVASDGDCDVSVDDDYWDIPGIAEPADDAGVSADDAASGNGSGSGYRMGGPRKRSKVEHHLSMARAREARAKKQQCE